MFSIAIMRGSQLFPHGNQRAYSNCTNYAIDASYLYHGYGILGIAVSINNRGTFITEEINVRSNHQASFNIKVHLPHRLGRLGWEGWKSGRTEDLLLLVPYIVIPSKQKKKAIGFFGHRDSL